MRNSIKDMNGDFFCVCEMTDDYFLPSCCEIFLKILTLKFVCTICTGYVIIVAITEAKAPIKKAVDGLGLFEFP